ncbi:uncharacterized protein RCC_10670 [Ramularia collo-cygni]|uniref:Uncharacterized protein n=1 Tax=Ramularia collo-cygni TaxID=112498 RepID=A0A2D3VKB7_9PEZI|nr:uncharacterized protein RCC_10670 [Ramularia collo-cygni]CZT24941.1 uncharacterized protein RCC_10670 [Ramularia collo-cygni]
MHALLRLPMTLRQVASDLLLTRTLTADDARGLLADDSATQHLRTRPVSRQGRRLWKLMGIIGLLISCGGLLFSKRPAANYNPSTPHEDHILHVLLPTRLHQLETCRTILSGAALNYPNPWAISWIADVDADGKDIGGDLAKLESILAFLEYQEPVRNDDIVIVLANPRSWFQVRPEVLLKRYRSIQQERQRQSLRQNASRELYELQHVKSKIVLSVEKKCLSKEGADCLPVQAEDNTPRFVSHNFVLGPVQELRLLYRDAVAEAKGLEDHHSSFDEHSVFARLYSTLQHVNSAPRDYTLGLDLVDRLSFAANSDVSSAKRLTASSEADVSFWAHKSTSGLTEDISKSEPPFRSSFGISRKGWRDVPLLTPKKAATVPAIVQHSSAYDPNASQAWFEHLWFHPHGRKLVQSYLASPRTPLSSFVDSDGIQQRFYGSHTGGVAAVAADSELHPWSEICEAKDFTSSLFADGTAT